MTTLLFFHYIQKDTEMCPVWQLSRWQMPIPTAPEGSSSPMPDWGFSLKASPIENPPPTDLRCWLSGFSDFTFLPETVASWLAFSSWSSHFYCIGNIHQASGVCLYTPICNDKVGVFLLFCEQWIEVEVRWISWPSLNNEPVYTHTHTHFVTRTQIEDRMKKECITSPWHV